MERDMAGGCEEGPERLRLARADIRERMCRTICAHYKPGRKEELVCGGFLAVERLLRKGTNIPFPVVGGIMPRSVQETLERSLCPGCPFHENDCDFVSRKEAAPCGGFLLLGHLLAMEVISVDNIREVG